MQPIRYIHITNVLKEPTPTRPRHPSLSSFNMRIFLLASLIFAHLLSASATKDVPLGLDDSTPVDLRALCEAPKPDYEAISQAAEGESPVVSPAVRYCLDIFSEGNNVSGLEALRGSRVFTLESHFSYFAETALKYGSIDALMFFFRTGRGR